MAGGRGAVGTVSVVVCGYALLTKVFPGSLNAGDTLGRLRAPFDYWNATGLMAALGLPACLWAGARPRAGRTLRALSVPAIAVLLTVMMLSYSRGALIAAAVGLACWFALVPLRLRATLLLGLGALGGVIATAWALGHHAITHEGASLAARTSAGHEFGVVLLVVVAVMALAGLGAALALDRTALPAQARRPDRHGADRPPGAGAGRRDRCGRRVLARADGRDLARVDRADEPDQPAARQQPRPPRGAREQPAAVLERGLKVGEHALFAGVGAGGFDTARPVTTRARSRSPTPTAT